MSKFVLDASALLALSLGDRACLSLAIATDSTALTADKVWQDLKTSAEVKLIR